MTAMLTGYVTYLCAANSIDDLKAVSDFSVNLNSVSTEYEIIVCVKNGVFSSQTIGKLCEEAQNLAVYEISTSSVDALYAAGLELALGDWILELTDSNSLLEDTKALMQAFDKDKENIADSYQLVPRRQPIIDRILCRLASSALETQVHTLAYVPRMSRRSALETWNTRKLRSKVLRVAPQLNRSIVFKLKNSSIKEQNYYRITRIGLRTLAHASAKPLRWVSFASLGGALISVAISAIVVLIGINRNVVPGWTTTNLQISGLSFLILLVLGILTEYIYQIAAAAIDQPMSRLVRETLSSRYAFLIKPNISNSINVEK